MPRRLIYSRQALADLDAVYRWQTQPGSGAAAVRRLKAIRDAIRDLKRHPCRHPLSQHAGVRELPCSGGYRVLYRMVPDTGRDETAGDVQVLRVFGPGQLRDRL
ncbi:MAG TPA: type II toxin-antitoxin system RelE/ParE family toxin [Stellaceae bacterium]|nr:type II toxin-antitoxin system RelE/ParE family toxin [Stellaceae bacterium]